MSESRNIIQLPDLDPRSFDPVGDFLLVQRYRNDNDPTDKKLYKVAFNDLMSVASLSFTKARTFWTALNEPYELIYSATESVNMQKRLPATTVKELGLDETFYYFDCKIAKIGSADTHPLPETAKYILLTMQHDNLEILDVGVYGRNGYRKLEADRGNYVFENMQFPRSKVIPFTTDLASKIPSTPDHNMMSPPNHVSFRCPIGTEKNQKIYINAYAE